MRPGVACGCVQLGAPFLPFPHLLPWALAPMSPGFPRQLLSVSRGHRGSWAIWGTPGLRCAHHLSLVVVSEPGSRSPEPASRLTTVSCCYHQPVLRPGLSPCHLSAGKDVRILRAVLTEGRCLPSSDVWAGVGWGELLSGSFTCGQVLTPSHSSSSCHCPPTPLQAHFTNYPPPHVLCEWTCPVLGQQWEGIRAISTGVGPRLGSQALLP